MALPLLTEVNHVCHFIFLAPAVAFLIVAGGETGCAEGHTAVASLGFLLFMRSLCFF